MPKKIIYTVLIVLVLAAIIAGAWLASSLKARKYSVVYLSSKEIYVGHLHTFPKLVLTEGYVLQSAPADAQSGQPSLQLSPLSGKAWAPAKIYLNRDQILFYGPLKEDSEAGRAIKAQASK